MPMSPDRHPQVSSVCIWGCVVDVWGLGQESSIGMGEKNPMAEAQPWEVA